MQNLFIVVLSNEMNILALVKSVIYFNKLHGYTVHQQC